MIPEPIYCCAAPSATPPAAPADAEREGKTQAAAKRDGKPERVKREPRLSREGV